MTIEEIDKIQAKLEWRLKVDCVPLENPIWEEVKQLCEQAKLGDKSDS